MPTRRPRRRVQQFIGAAFARRNCLYAGHDRSHQSGGLVVWRRVSARRRRGDSHRHGAPCRYCAVAALAAPPQNQVAGGHPSTSGANSNSRSTKQLFNEHTRLVCVAHVSNVLGTINPVREMIAYAHAQGVPVLVDGAQAIPHLRVNVQELDADFYAFSAHKVYGPTGIGILYGKEKWLDAIPPYQGGGEMIAHVDFSGTTFGELPFKFEAGTPDYVGTAAFASALDYVDSIGLEAIAAHENELLRYTTAQMEQIEGMRIFGTSPHKSSVISFLVDGIHHYDMGMLLDKLGVAVRTGHHCAQPLMTLARYRGARCGCRLPCTIPRAEADAFIAALKR